MLEAARSAQGAAVRDTIVSDTHSLTASTRRIQAPTLVVWGRHDPIAVHAMAERLVAVRPGTPLFTMEDVGHYPMVEDPDGFAAAVLRMLDGALAGDS